MELKALFLGFLALVGPALTQTPNCHDVITTLDTLCACNGRELDCSNKQLDDHLSNKTWAALPMVTKASFSYNKIIRLTAFPPSNITELSLSHNLIASIDTGAFKELRLLKKLDLSHNHLTTSRFQPHALMGHYSPTAYEPMDQLEILDLGSNLLHSLNSDIFEHTPNIKILKLNSNPFKILDHSTIIALADLTELEVLDLSSTMLNSLYPTMFHPHAFLKILNLSDNYFTSVPMSLAEAHVLEELVMDNNPISFLSSFPNVSTLKTLSLSDMPELQRIEPYALSNLTNLQNLICTHNEKFSEIYDNAFSYVVLGANIYLPLRKLDLSYNRLEYLNGELVNWLALEHLDLQGNPWVCDCENQHLIDVLPRFLAPNQTLNMVCHEPDELRGEFMSDIARKKRHLRCIDYYGNHPEGDGKILIGALVGVLVAVPITLGLMALYMKRYHKVIPYSRAHYKRAFSETT